MRSFPDWVHDELCNWARFCWEGEYPQPVPPNHCYSFEHNYLAPSDMGCDDAPSTRILANARHALIVQDVYVVLPITQRLVLRAEYPQRIESGRAEFGKIGAARRLKMRVSEYDAALTAAAGSVRRAFE